MIITLDGRFICLFDHVETVGLVNGQTGLVLLFCYNIKRVKCVLN